MNTSLFCIGQRPRNCCISKKKNDFSIGIASSLSLFLWIFACLFHLYQASINESNEQLYHKTVSVGEREREREFEPGYVHFSYAELYKWESTDNATHFALAEWFIAAFRDSASSCSMNMFNAKLRLAFNYSSTSLKMSSSRLSWCLSFSFQGRPCRGPSNENKLICGGPFKEVLKQSFR